VRASPCSTIYDENIILDGEFLKELKQLSPLVLNVRSSLANRMVLFVKNVMGGFSTRKINFVR
jgi:hypothetical protein